MPSAISNREAKDIAENDGSSRATGTWSAGSGSISRRNSQLVVPRRSELCTGAALQWQQFKALNNKNLLIRGRAWKTNLLIVAQAVLFVLLTWGVDRGVAASRSRQPAFRNREQGIPVEVGPVPDCGDSIFLRQDQPCYTLLYAPQGVEAVEKVVWGVAGNNDPPLPPSHIRGFQNASDIDAFLLDHPETVLASVVFMVEGGWGPGGAGEGVSRIGFTVQTNSSVQWFKGRYQDPNTYMQLPLQSAVERELVRLLAGRESGPGWGVSLTEFPHPASQSPSMIGQFAPTFLFASIMFQFVLLVHDMVSEKEAGVRRMMTTMGLRNIPFWSSWVLFQGLLAVVEAGLLVGFSWAFGFDLFTKNAFPLSFLLLLLVSLSMTALGFLVASCLKQAASAVPAGFVIFIIAWVFQVVIAFGFPFSTKYSSAAVAAFSTMPWTLLAKGVADLSEASKGRLPGLSWSQRSSYCQADPLSPHQLADLADLGVYWQEGCVMPLGQIFWVLAIQCAAYMALALYFDAVLPDGNGVKRPPWFLLQPSYWLPGKVHCLKGSQRALAAKPEWEEGLLVDQDVQQESEKMRERCRRRVERAGGGAHGQPVPAASAGIDTPMAGVEDLLKNAGDAGGGGGGIHITAECRARGNVPYPAAPLAQQTEELADKLANGANGSLPETQQERQLERQYAVEMYGLRREFRSGALLRRRPPSAAVRGSWLGIYEGECFCLLGPNGAGKSTSIHCLTGVLPLSAGDAVVYGQSIATSAGMDAVRPVMGVCPQFDVLWDHLTGMEHLLLFAAIKGLHPHGTPQEAAALLEDVRLSEAGGVRAGAYSGGMRRRLSVAIALLGDPKVVYLDEPTTGLDPISRRHLWDLIDRAKRGRAIVLTTHSMEEADILGDRIGIMARGRLRCIGNSLRLKSRFGSGYKISVRVQGGRQYKDPVMAVQVSRVRAVFWDRLGVRAVDETQGYLHFLVPYENEDKLSLLFTYLKAHSLELGVADIQLRLTPLEEVFLNVSRKAELEHAQAEGHVEMLCLPEENIAIKVPSGAEFIQSPGGHLYHITWRQDETGALKLHDFWRDPVSSAVLAGGELEAEGRKSEEGTAAMTDGQEQERSGDGD